jgi:hypothetical protein
MRVLGAISVKNIKNISGSKLGSSCFMALNEENDTWDICADGESERKEWINAISTALGIKPPKIGDKSEDDNKPKVIKEEVVVK